MRVRAIILNDFGQILLGKRHDNTYMLPGGGIKEKEHPVDALLREVKEETGYVVFESLEYLWEYLDNHVFLYVIKDQIQSPSPLNDPSKEFTELHWFDFSSLPNVDPYAEDIIYRFLRAEVLQEKFEVDAGVIEVLVDDKKVYELEDDVIWETLPKLAQERAKGRSVKFRQVLDDGTVVDQTPDPMPVKSDLNVVQIDKIIDDLLNKYIPSQKSRPIVEILTEADFLAKTIWHKKSDQPSSLVIQVNSKILGDEKILRQVLAHEVIHVHLYQKFGDQVAKHGEYFHWYANKINQKEGDNYVSQYADHTDFNVAAGCL